MHGKGHQLAGAGKEFPDGLAALGIAQDAAVPDGILGKQRGQFLGVVVVVAGRGVARFELLDILDVRQSLYGFFQPVNLMVLC